MDFYQSQALKKKFHEVIPGGCHTYAKGDDQYPEPTLTYIVRGDGCHVWDVDGNEFIEYGMGMRAVTLGHAYKPVVEAAYKQMQQGCNFVRPSPIELTCAEQLLRLVKGAEMVKFGKNGSDANNAAIRLARAYTGRDMIAICGNHPFYSVDDWFIGTTPMSSGIPKVIQDLTVKFNYNDMESVRALFRQYLQRIACIILEPEKDQEPVGNFLQDLKALCHQEGAILIFDENITGFRWHNGGAQSFYNVTPDLSTFGKALGNGFAISALVGKKELMQLGGLDHERERVFLMSLTHGAEAHGLAAALETMRNYEKEPVVETLWARGLRLASNLKKSIDENHLSNYIRIVGKPCCLGYVTLNQEGQSSQSFRTLLLQETIKRGILAPSLVVSYSHSEADIDRTVEIFHEAFKIYRKALEEGVEKYLIGRAIKPVWRRFN